MPKSPEPDRVLLGRYRLEKRLDEGGMGQIWLAEHLVLGAPVAVKIIDRDVSRDEEALARFNREAQAAAQLRSPHVVQILDYGIDEGTPFIAMELLEGETLARRLKRDKRLGPAETARYINHVARAVSRAHEAGIVHRDLKPENVFLVHNGDDYVAKVLDFGVAKVEASTLGPKGERTRTGSLLGTPFYMSPEQAQGNKTVDFRTDLWAMGVMAFECLTGKRPFESEGLGDLVLSICVRPIPIPSEHGPVPAGFDEWFAKATEREPDDRYQSARELAETLRSVLSEADGDVQVTIPDLEEEWGATPAQTAPDEPKGDAATLKAPSGDAKTVKVDSPEQFAAGAIGEVAVTGDTLASVLPPRRGPKPWVVATVAAAALTAGAVGTVAFMQSEPLQEEDADSPVSVEPLNPKAVVTTRQPSGSGASATSSAMEAAAAPDGREEERKDAKAAAADASADGLSPAAQHAAAVMKGLVERDASAPTPAPAASE